MATERDGVACDALGCLARTKGNLSIADVMRPEALAEDCRTAEIVVSEVPVRGLCKGPRLVIGPRDLSRSNGVAIWLGSNIHWQSVEQARGRRPWSAQARPWRDQYRRRRPTSLP